MKSAANPLWRWSLNSITGSSHLQEGTACQDVFGMALLGVVGDVAVIAISDGAGSAAFSRQGAEIVVESWLRYFSEVVASARDPAAAIQKLNRANVEAVLQSIRREVDLRARELECSASEFSATLLGCVVSPEATFVAQVGDGCWVGEVDGVLGCLTWPLQGEFASQTHFATSDSAASVLQCVHVPSTLSSLAGFTDGVERIALHLAPRLPERGFFEPLFELVRKYGSGAERAIGSFLNSERIRAESDDDKTLMILVRNERDLR